MGKDTKVDPKYGEGVHSICPFCGMYTALEFPGGFFSCRAFMWCGEAGKIVTRKQRKTYKDGVSRDKKKA